MTKGVIYKCQPTSGPPREVIKKRKMRHGEVGRVGGGRGGSLTELWAMGMSSARGRFGGCTAQKGSRRRERSERAGRAKMTSRKHIGKARMTNRRCVRGTMADKMMIVARGSDRCAWALIQRSGGPYLTTPPCFALHAGLLEDG